MIGELQRSSSWLGKGIVLVVALVGVGLHQFGAPERAFAAGGGTLIVGTLFGLSMLAIVGARLMGRDIGLIRSDIAAVGALLMMIFAKIAIARIFLP